MAGEAASRASFTDYNSAFKGSKGNSSHENSPDYAHRRSYSDIYNSPPSFVNKAAYAIQPYTPTSFQYRERRTSSWDLSSDPELMRKKRLASYKVYGIEGTVKSRVKKSFRWMKGKYNEIVYGFK